MDKCNVINEKGTDMERIEKILTRTQFVSCVAAYALIAVWSAAHIVMGNIHSLGGYAMCLAMVLVLRRATMKAYDEMADAENSKSNK